MPCSSTISSIRLSAKRHAQSLVSVFAVMSPLPPLQQFLRRYQPHQLAGLDFHHWQCAKSLLVAMRSAMLRSVSSG